MLFSYVNYTAYSYYSTIDFWVGGGERKVGTREVMEARKQGSGCKIPKGEAAEEITLRNVFTIGKAH